MKTPEAQKVWDALKKIFGENLEAASLNVLFIDGYKLEYKTLVFPNDLKEKDNENT